MKQRSGRSDYYNVKMVMQYIQYNINMSVLKCRALNFRVQIVTNIGIFVCERGDVKFNRRMR